MRNGSRNQEAKLAILFMLPAIVFLSLIVIYPLITTIYDSFFDASLVRRNLRVSF